MVMLPRQNIKVDILPPKSSRSSWGGRNTAGNNQRQRKYNADLTMPQYLYKEVPKQPAPELLVHNIPRSEFMPETPPESVVCLAPSKLMEADAGIGS